MRKLSLMLVAQVFAVVLNVVAGLNDGLVAYYPFNGNANDESGNGNNGIVQGALAAPDRSGASNGALSFDGDNDYVSVGDITLGNTFTLSAWVKLDGTHVDNNSPTIFSSYPSRGAFDQLFVAPYVSGPDVLNFMNGGSTEGIRTTQSFCSNRWTHVAVVYRDGQSTLYVDAVAQATGVFASATGHLTTIGSWMPTASDIFDRESWKGLIDEVRIYNRPLSAGEVLQLAGGLNAGLIAYYPFNGNADDASGNGYNGIVQGALTAPDRSGATNGAMSFDGDDDYVSVGDITLGNTFTLSAWVKLDGTHVDNNSPTIFSSYPSQGAFDQLFVAPYVSGPDLLNFMNGGSTEGIRTTQPFCSNRWTYVAAVYSDGQVTLYVDGMARATGTFASATGHVTTIGAWMPTATAISDRESWKGLLDEVRIYNRALSSAEVRQLAGGLNAGLIAYYPFNGNADDASGNGYNGIVQGALAAPDRNGTTNGAMSFDGDDDYVSVGDLDLGDRFTLCSWVELSASHVDENSPTIFSAYPFLGAYDQVYVSPYPPGSNDILNLTGGGSGMRGSQTFATDMWHYVVVAYDQGNCALFVDGVKQAEQTIPLSSGHLTTIGSWMAADSSILNREPWVGSIDEVRIYNRALSVAEIRELAGGLRDGLVAYYPFNGNADDASGNEYYGALHGALPVPDRNGASGGALRFDGDNDYVSVGDITIGNTFTLSAWVNLDGTHVDNNSPTIFSSYPSRGAFDQLFVAPYVSGPDVLNFMNGGSTESIRTTQSFCSNRWTHVAVVYRDGQSTLYVDAVAQATGVFASATGHLTTIGAWMPTATAISDRESWKGLIDEVRIYNRPLSAFDVHQLYALNEGDQDEDGIPDWWLVQYFGHPTGHASDLSRAGDSAAGDRYSNLWKYLNGINPLQFYIGPTVICTAVEISWESVGGTNYQVQWASKLDSNTWVNLGGPTFGNGTTNSVFDSTRDSKGKFYRVILAP